MKKGKRRIDIKRDETIYSMRQKGMLLREIAVVFLVTPERIRTIVNRHRYRLERRKRFGHSDTYKKNYPLKLYQ